MTGHSKNIVIFAGAGISKEPPANLFSWWEYNRLIIHEIGEAGARAAKRAGNLLDADEVLQKVPVSTISDYLFNYSAGAAYFPLLKILEGSNPNRNHHLLAQLAESGELSGIITTNFDTLIEQAFDRRGMAYDIYLHEEDFASTAHKEFPIYKIHGSVTDTDTAIDTAQQKLQGLSKAKRQLLSKIFRENHIIFMGFSGEDFAFDRDYLPLADIKFGITWILNPDFGKVHEDLQWIEDPKSYSRLSIHVRKCLDRVENFKLCIATIPEFCAFMGWNIGDAPADMSYDETQTSARQTVKEFLSSMAVTEWGCAGMCIELLRTVKSSQAALDLAVQVDRILSGWMGANQGQDRYILLPIIEQTVSDLLVETMPPGTEQITETDRLMPLCDTLADTFKIAKMYNKAMKYYYFSLCITNQRFLEHIIENDYAKLRKTYNNMSTTKMRIGKMLIKMNRVRDAIRFFAEAMEDALKAGRFYNIVSAFLCRVEIDIRTMHEKTPEKVSRLYADLWCAIRLAQKAGNSRALCEAYWYMTIFFAECHMFSYVPLALECMEAYAKITAEAALYLEMIEELKRNLPDGIERADTFPQDLQYCEPQYDTAWEECRERNVLSTEEGREAYRLTCLGRDEAARTVLKEAADRYYGSCFDGNSASDGKEMYLAEMFSYCYIKLEAKSRNSFGIQEAEIYLQRCLELEIRLWQSEYLTETTAYISQYYYGIEAYAKALLYAELCLCFCDNPIAHGLILSSCAIAALSCINTDKKSDAIYYGNLYFQFAKKFPPASDPAIKEYLRDWLEHCEA